MKSDARIFVAGHRGLVGSALVRALERHGHRKLLLKTHAELDLEDGPAVRRYFADARPEYVFMAAAKVGGIYANDTLSGDFIRSNLLIQTNVIDAAYRAGLKRLQFLGSSCIYPKHAPQPIKEEYLLTGALEPTNEAYAIAKIAGVEMCRAYNKQFGTSYVSVQPTNLYGPGDNFDLKTSHVLPALVRKFHEAKVANAPSVMVWGSGTPRREFLHVDDLAEACVFLMDRGDAPDLVNVGAGKDISIAELASLVKEIVGYEGRIEYDRSKPDGTPRKLLDVTRMTSLGWEPRISLRDGIASFYGSYLETQLART
ncbi:MAG TPA: GDP-L-fucose synthase [Gemmatimonadaceae bacterium]